MFSSLFSSFSNPVYCEASTKASEDLPEPAAQSDESSKGLGEKGAEEAEAEEAPAAVEEEDEEEPEDLAPGIREACAQTKPCAAFKHHFDECTERVLSGKTHIKGEDCVEELFHFMHCVDDCSAAKVFASLK